MVSTETIMQPIKYYINYSVFFCFAVLFIMIFDAEFSVATGVGGLWADHLF